MKYRVAIRRNADGRVHVTRWSPFNGDREGLEYYWEEGNNACDCNRHHEFEAVADDREVEWADRHPCGDTEYSVVRIETEESFSGQPAASPR